MPANTKPVAGSTVTVRLLSGATLVLDFDAGGVGACESSPGFDDCEWTWVQNGDIWYLNPDESHDTAPRIVFMDDGSCGITLRLSQTTVTGVWQ